MPKAAFSEGVSRNAPAEDTRLFPGDLVDETFERPIVKFSVKVQHDFFRKVFGIVLLQWIFTAAFFAYALWTSPVWLHYPAVLILSTVGTLACGLLVLFWPSAAERVPMNYAILEFFTVCSSVTIAAAFTVSAIQERGLHTVLCALLLAIGVVGSLTAFALQMLGAALIWVFTPQVEWLDLGIALLAAALLSLHLVLHVRHLVDPVRGFNLDSHVLAVLLLYSGR